MTRVLFVPMWNERGKQRCASVCDDTRGVNPLLLLTLATFAPEYRWRPQNVEDSRAKLAQIGRERILIERLHLPLVEDSTNAITPDRFNSVEVSASVRLPGNNANNGKFCRGRRVEGGSATGPEGRAKSRRALSSRAAGLADRVSTQILVA